MEACDLEPPGAACPADENEDTSAVEASGDGSALTSALDPSLTLPPPEEALGHRLAALLGPSIGSSPAGAGDPSSSAVETEQDDQQDDSSPLDEDQVRQRAELLISRELLDDMCNEPSDEEAPTSQLNGIGRSRTPSPSDRHVAADAPAPRLSAAPRLDQSFHHASTNAFVPGASSFQGAWSSPAQHSASLVWGNSMGCGGWGAGPNHGPWSPAAASEASRGTGPGNNSNSIQEGIQLAQLRAQYEKQVQAISDQLTGLKDRLRKVESESTNTRAAQNAERKHLSKQISNYRYTITNNGIDDDYDDTTYGAWTPQQMAQSTAQQQPQQTPQQQQPWAFGARSGLHGLAAGRGSSSGAVAEKRILPKAESLNSKMDQLNALLQEPPTKSTSSQKASNGLRGDASWSSPSKQSGLVPPPPPAASRPPAAPAGNRSGRMGPGGMAGPPLAGLSFQPCGKRDNDMLGMPDGLDGGDDQEDKNIVSTLRDMFPNCTIREVPEADGEPSGSCGGASEITAAAAAVQRPAAPRKTIPDSHAGTDWFHGALDEEDDFDDIAGPGPDLSQGHSGGDEPWTMARVEKAAQRGFEFRNSGRAWDFKLSMGGKRDPPMTVKGMERYCRWIGTRFKSFAEENGPDCLRNCRTYVDFSHSGLNNEMVWRLLETLVQQDLNTVQLKLFGNGISQGGVLAICEFLRTSPRSAGALQELHLSHNEVDDDAALELLRTINTQRPKYPPHRLNEKSGESVPVPLWLQLNRNKIRDPQKVLKTARNEGVTVCEAWDRQACGTNRCCSRGACPLVHLYNFGAQAESPAAERREENSHREARGSRGGARPPPPPPDPRAREADVDNDYDDYENPKRPQGSRSGGDAEWWKQERYAGKESRSRRGHGNP